ncbi:MAG TPA: TraB/GumN family protein [Rhizomicrobium sp.]|nr:TraB/GumN family protein [Rhizomicrobium sp.]
MKSWAVFLVAFVFLALPCAAETPAAPLKAHPTLWTVHGKNSTVYLFGSIHLLPPNLVWRDERIDNAIRAADTFVFETALDSDMATKFIAAHGSLPAGQSLKALLPDAAQEDLAADMAAVKLPEERFDTRRPWVVSVVLETVRATESGASPASGVDVTIMADAAARAKPVRYLETFEQQMALLAPADPALELKTFEAFLKDFRNEGDELPAIIRAWSAGDQDKLAKLTLHSLAEDPAGRKRLIDDRNKAWITSIAHMLDSESGTFLVTVGALHLLGHDGVPALLRQRGYKVDGP